MAKFLSQGAYNEKELKISPTVKTKLPDFDQENVQTYFDIVIEAGDQGRGVFELFTKVVPQTVENFR